MASTLNSHVSVTFCFSFRIFSIFLLYLFLFCVILFVYVFFNVKYFFNVFYVVVYLSLISRQVDNVLEVAVSMSS